MINLSLFDREYDLIIIGGGVAGLAAALGAVEAERKCNILLLEKNNEFGKNIRGELIYDDEEILDIIFPEGLPLHLINIQIATARYYSPSTKEYYEKIYTRNKISIEYRILVQELIKLILKKGCKISLGTIVTEIEQINNIYSVINCKFNDNFYSLKTKCIISADGVKSKLREQVGLKEPNSIYPMIKTIAENVKLEDKNRLEFFLTVNPPGVIWIFPKSGDTAEVGFTIFTDFIEEEKFELEKIFFNHLENYPILKDRLKNSGIIYQNLDFLPFGGMIYENFIPNIIFIGDSMGHVGAVGGSGIISSMSIGFLTGNFLANNVNKLTSELFLELNNNIKKSDIGKFLKKEMKQASLIRNLLYKSLGTLEKIDANWEKIKALMTSR